MRDMRDKLKESFAQVQARQAEAERQAEAARQATEEAREARARAEQAAHEGRLEAAAQLEGVVERTSSAAQLLSAQMEEVSQGAEEQRSRVASTATAMEEMNATVLEVASTSSDAARKRRRRPGTRPEQVQGHHGPHPGCRDSVQANTKELSVVMDELAAKAQSIGQVNERDHRHCGPDQPPGPQRGHRGGHAPGTPAAASRWWPTRCANWPRRP
jgi:methyl-accepting chemotaxis protein